MKKHMEKSKMPVANIYFVLGCSKPAAMVSRVPKINVVSSLYFYYELHIEDEYHHAVHAFISCS